jgi:DUF438 domain-containing protein
MGFSLREFMKWDKFLLRDHARIERAMDVLRSELGKIESLRHSQQGLKRAVEFLLEYGANLHNRREEEFLFPLMEKRGFPRQGPLGVMFAEHKQEKEILQSMLRQSDVLREASSEQRKEFVQHGLQYLKIRAEHIWKETDILFVKARSLLTEEDNEKLIAEFTRIDEDTYGENHQEIYDKMLREVEEGDEAVRHSLLDNLSREQIDAILDTLPMEISFVDDKDSVAYFNRLDKEKIFDRTRSAVGRRVDKCHPEESHDKMYRVMNALKSGEMKSADFWIDHHGDKLLIRYLSVHNKNGKYLGILEVNQKVTHIQKLAGQSREGVYLGDLD